MNHPSSLRFSQLTKPVLFSSLVSVLVPALVHLSPLATIPSVPSSDPDDIQHGPDVVEMRGRSERERGFQ